MNQNSRISWLGLLPLLCGCALARQPRIVQETAADVEVLRQQQAALEVEVRDLKEQAGAQAEILRGLKAETSLSLGQIDARLAAIDAKLGDALGSRAAAPSRGPSVWSAVPPGRTPARSDSPIFGEPAAPSTADSGQIAGAASPAGETAAGEVAPQDAGRQPAPWDGDQPVDGDNKRLYDHAYLDLTRGNYSLAVMGFREFLKRAPASELADNAQYWVGEAFYAQRDFDQAVQEFLKVKEGYPRGDKLPAALLKVGYSFIQLGDRASARRYLKQVTDQFPNSDEAGLAKSKLRGLGD